MKPDALILDSMGVALRAIEFGGNYPIERLEQIHLAFSSIDLATRLVRGQTSMELARRQMRFLAFIARYRAATDELLRRKFAHAHKDCEFIRRTMIRLARKGYVREFKIGKGEWYYILSRRGARVVQRIDHTPRLLTEQSLPVALGIAYFCVKHGYRYTAAEFRKEISRPESAESSFVGLLLRRDRRGNEDWHVRGRCRCHAKATSRKDPPSHRQAVLPASLRLSYHSGRFRITVLVSTETQWRKLTTDLANHSFGDVEVEVAWVPELEHLEKGA